MACLVIVIIIVICTQQQISMPNKTMFSSSFIFPYLDDTKCLTYTRQLMAGKLHPYTTRSRQVEQMAAMFVIPLKQAEETYPANLSRLAQVTCSQTCYFFLKKFYFLVMSFSHQIERSSIPRKFVQEHEIASFLS